MFVNCKFSRPFCKKQNFCRRSPIRRIFTTRDFCSRNKSLTVTSDSIELSVIMSSAQDEVLSIRRKLEKMTESGDQGQALDMLQRLGDIDMNLGILTQTRIGMTVNALRKSSSDGEVISQAKSLIKAWKKFVPENNEKKDKTSSQESNGKNNSSSQNDKPAKDKAGSGEKTFVQQKASATADDVRLGCRRLLATALRGKQNSSKK